MTTQFSDHCLFNQCDYTIAGVNGYPLFEPATVGLAPASVMSACRRGFVCIYSIMQNRLCLKTLYVTLGHYVGVGHQRTFVPQQGPLIHATVPTFSVERSALFNNTYYDMNIDIPFTGALLLADGFIDKLHVHMGFHPAWKYTTVLEIICEAGHVQAWRDVSQRVAEIRNERLKHPIKPGTVNREELQAWIESTFRLNYEL